MGWELRDYESSPSSCRHELAILSEKVNEGEEESDHWLLLYILIAQLFSTSFFKCILAKVISVINKMASYNQNLL